MLISRRSFLQLTAAATLASGCRATWMRRLQGYNVVLVIIDDMRPWLHCYGHTVAKLPNLNRLAERSSIFLQAYAHVPHCPGSRGSLFTGVYPDATRFSYFSSKMSQHASTLTTLPLLLKSAGVGTYSFGKVFHVASDVPESWDRNIARVDSQSPFPGYMRIRQSQPFASKETERSHTFPSSIEVVDLPIEEFFDWKIAREARRTLASLANWRRHFYLNVGLRRPHLPYVVPKQYWDWYTDEDIDALDIDTAPRQVLTEIFGAGAREFQSYRDVPSEGAIPESKRRELLRGYLASMSYVDAVVGAVLDTIYTSRLAENTVVLVTSDHGISLGEYGYFGKGTLLPEALQVPLLVALPGVKAQQRITAPVGLVDLYPSIAELVGLTQLPNYLHGRSLTRFFQSSTTETDTQVYARLGGRYATLLTDEYQFINIVGQGTNPGTEVTFARNAGYHQSLGVESTIHQGMKERFSRFVAQHRELFGRDMSV